MDTITINVEEWQEMVRKIDEIAEFIYQYTVRLPNDNTWLNEAEVCNYLKISTKTLQRLRNKGEIGFSTIAKKHYYKAGDIKALLERKAVKSGREQLEKLKKSYKRR
ncbi:MAG: helix-turn-helix domain-containing protein [Dysgonamonadaceae bacterium]|nr:helix-turn-helix domain-containing protein [Dysgonamonadaceae bacterium]